MTKWELRCPQCKSYRVKQVELTRAKCLECDRTAHVSIFRDHHQKAAIMTAVKTHHTLYFGWAYHLYVDGKVVYGDLGYTSEQAARAAGEVRSEQRDNTK